MRTSRFQLDLAYGCYLFCGVSVLIVSAIEAGLPSHDVVVGLGFALIAFAIPLLVALGVALLVGVALSLRHRKHWPLLTLGAMSVGLIGVGLTEFGSTKLFFRSVTLIYGVVVLVLSGRWFFALRSRCMSTAEGS